VLLILVPSVVNHPISQCLTQETPVVSLSRCPVFIAPDLSGFAFSSLLSFSLRVSRRRRCGNVEIRRFWVWPDFQARWKEGESPNFDFSTLSTARHFHSVVRAVFSRPPATGLAPCTDVGTVEDGHPPLQVLAAGEDHRAILLARTLTELKIAEPNDCERSPSKYVLSTLKVWIATGKKGSRRERTCGDCSKL